MLITIRLRGQKRHDARRFKRAITLYTTLLLVSANAAVLRNVVAEIPKRKCFEVWLMLPHLFLLYSRCNVFFTDIFFSVIFLTWTTSDIVGVTVVRGWAVLHITIH
jgi:hypothetical protein